MKPIQEVLRKRIQVELQIPNRFAAITQKGHRLIGVSALRFQKFKDPPLWLTVPIVDKGHTLRVTFRRDAFADDHFKPAFLAVGLLATVDIATVQSDRERGSRVRQRWIFIVLWGNKKKPFFSQFL